VGERHASRNASGMMKPSSLVASLALALVLSGCGATTRELDRGTTSYQHADYRAAMIRWRYLEDREPEMKPKARVRYLVYRGLTHYRLFQRSAEPMEQASALHFLARGKAAYDTGKPRWLTAEMVVQMKDALDDLAHRAAGNATGVVVLQAPPPPQVRVAPQPPAAVDD
jgi:hypothetical protein